MMKEMKMNCMNKQGHPFLPVEYVESVEGRNNHLKTSNLIILKPSTESKLNDVESVEKVDLALYFSTLSTILKTKSVEEKQPKIPLISIESEDIPRVPQIPQEKNNEFVCFRSFDRMKVLLVIEWLQIVIDEGHIEPSQPFIGRIVGWPVRSLFIDSLYVDFVVWCRKREKRDWNIPEPSLFFALLNHVLIRVKEKYEFPPLNICRNKFLCLREMLLPNSIYFVSTNKV